MDACYEGSDVDMLSTKIPKQGGSSLCRVVMSSLASFMMIYLGDGPWTLDGRTVTYASSQESLPVIETPITDGSRHLMGIEDTVDDLHERLLGLDFHNKTDILLSLPLLEKLDELIEEDWRVFSEKIKNEASQTIVEKGLGVPSSDERNLLRRGLLFQGIMRGYKGFWEDLGHDIPPMYDNLAKEENHDKMNALDISVCTLPICEHHNLKAYVGGFAFSAVLAIETFILTSCCACMCCPYAENFFTGCAKVHRSYCGLLSFAYIHIAYLFIQMCCEDCKSCERCNCLYPRRYKDQLSEEEEGKLVRCARGCSQKCPLWCNYEFDEKVNKNRIQIFSCCDEKIPQTIIL